MTAKDNPIKFIIYGAPPSMKNDLRRSASGHFYHADNAVMRYKQDFALQCPAKFKQELTCPVSVNMVIYAKDRRKDFSNAQDIIFDSLEYAKVIKNDRLIVAWQGRGYVDKLNPRIVIEISSLTR